MHLDGQKAGNGQETLAGMLPRKDEMTLVFSLQIMTLWGQLGKRLLEE